MGAKKFKTVDASGEGKKKQSYEDKKKKRQEEMEQMLSAEISTQVPTAEAASEPVEEKKVVKARGKKYVQARSQVDKSKIYTFKDAIALLRSIKYTKFDESVDLHLVLRDILANIDVAFPHTTGKKMRVVILNEDVTAELDKGIINFEVLLATPGDMKKITKYAKLLGPRGLMPNPKNGTLTPDPAKKLKQLEGGMVTVRGEKKAPLMHVTIGKLSQPDSEIMENAETLIKAIGSEKILKISMCTSMGPGVRATA